MDALTRWTRFDSEKFKIAEKNMPEVVADEACGEACPNKDGGYCIRGKGHSNPPDHCCNKCGYLW